MAGGQGIDADGKKPRHASGVRIKLFPRNVNCGAKTAVVQLLRAADPQSPYRAPDGTILSTSTGSRSTARRNLAAGRPVSSFPFRPFERRRQVARHRPTSKPIPTTRRSTRFVVTRYPDVAKCIARRWCRDAELSKASGDFANAPATTIN